MAGAELGRVVVGLDSNPVALRIAQRRLRAQGSVTALWGSQPAALSGLVARLNDGKLVVEGITDAPFEGDWVQLVEAIAIDCDWDGQCFRPSVIDAPARRSVIAGRYALPSAAGRVCAQAVLVDGSLRWWCSR